MQRIPEKAQEESGRNRPVPYLRQQATHTGKDDVQGLFGSRQELAEGEQGMSIAEKIRWLTILKDAEATEGFVTVFEEDEEVSVQELLTEVIEDYRSMTKSELDDD